jgi:rRNA maturation protein Rpf1
LNGLLKELAHSIPESKIIRRGKSNIEDLNVQFLDEGVIHAIVLSRWHGGPGRIDFFAVEPLGLKVVAPSVLLTGARLRREYPDEENYIAQGITCDPASSERTRNFSRTLSRVLQLPELSLASHSLKATFHISELQNRRLRLVVTSPPGEHEVGPSLEISKLVWDVDETDQR